MEAVYKYVCSKVYMDISNTDKSFLKYLEIIIPKITEFVSPCNINFKKLSLPSLALVDQNLGQSHKIDVLFSASFLFEILETGKYK